MLNKTGATQRNGQPILKVGISSKGDFGATINSLSL